MSSNTFHDFNSFIESVNENTADDYKYHFTYDGNDYNIHQGKDDKTIFGIKDKEGNWKAMTKGRLFDHANYDKTLDEMVEFIQKGIKFFNVRNPVEVDDVKGSEWEKFFKFEIRKHPGRINKKYVILKLHCGKAACKWLATN